MGPGRIWLAGLLAVIALSSGCTPEPTSVPTMDVCRGTAEAQGFEIEDLTRQRDELQDWTNQLAEGYGPGVWYFGVPGYPIFHHTPEDQSLGGIAAELNILLEADANPLIILGDVKDNTITVQLSDDAALTQRMGSSGAQSYLQVVLYSLTSLPGIDCVDFQFVEGDHARPGLYCR